MDLDASTADLECLDGSGEEESKESAFCESEREA